MFTEVRSAYSSTDGPSKSLSVINKLQGQVNTFRIWSTIGGMIEF